VREKLINEEDLIFAVGQHTEVARSEPIILQNHYEFLLNSGGIQILLLKNK
jgi:hypothetical protein